MLELKNVEVKYGSVTAVHSVNLTVNAGEFVALIGSNGAGKTTLLKTISGLIQPSRGEITLNGQRINGQVPNRITRAGIAHVPEGRQVFPDLTVLENLEMGGFVFRNQRAVFQQQLEMVMDLFPRLAQRRAQLGGTLSGGEQQMLAVGRALMSKPRLILLDEPSLGLAPRLVQEMFEFLARLHRETQMALLLVEQLAELALMLAERGYVIENGRIILEGTGESLREDTRIQQIYLGMAH
jgi:branched-chain amino acid transport system ATP-binding protein